MGPKRAHTWSDRGLNLHIPTRAGCRFQEEIQRLKDQLAGQGGSVDGDGASGQVFNTPFRYKTFGSCIIYSLVLAELEDL